MKGGRRISVDAARDLGLAIAVLVFDDRLSLLIFWIRLSLLSRRGLVGCCRRGLVGLCATTTTAGGPGNDDQAGDYGCGEGLPASFASLAKWHLAKLADACVFSGHY
ncbi:hypothetical protein AU192_11260 [Mycobacterium lehmannii]|uniref:Uncharacterized protein n=1 Tax=Mycobacterium lehmannii TaxID=2048550 RepID=A0A101AE93_9MYCO|nr:hypothetical protein AU192_11260 [Mycobacterium lehmannii]